MSPSSPSTPPARHTAEALLRGAKPTINLLEVTLERLGSAIKMGLYEPGDRLPSERELARMMGISRSTVREAIHLMTEQGILVAKRGVGGTFVSEYPLPESLMTLRHRLNQAGATLSEILDHRLVVEMGIAKTLI
jgi:GntR family transcriptional repressor for pyruvate dehydrogenase complex